MQREQNSRYASHNGLTIAEGCALEIPGRSSGSQEAKPPLAKPPSREKARHWVGRSASGVSALSSFVAKSRQTMHTFPPPPLKFRTTGFPQYGFKLAFSRYDLQPRGERLSDKPTCTLGIRPYTQPPVLHGSPAALAGMIAGPIVRTFQSRGPWLAGGFCCPTRLSLLWPHLRLSSPSPLYVLWRQVHARRSALGWVREGPHFSSVYLFPSCHLPYPDGWNGSHWLSSPFPLAFTVFALVRHPYRHHRRFSGGQRHEAAKFALCYGPKRLLALPRQGRLRSSFHLPSRLQETSNIATRQTSNSRDRTFTGKIDSPHGLQAKIAKKPTQFPTFCENPIHSRRSEAEPR